MDPRDIQLKLFAVCCNGIDELPFICILLQNIIHLEWDVP